MKGRYEVRNAWEGDRERKQIEYYRGHKKKPQQHNSDITGKKMYTNASFPIIKNLIVTLLSNVMLLIFQIPFWIPAISID